VEGPRVDLAIAGGGTMGAGIAQVAVTHGLTVALYDAVPAALERAVARVQMGLGRGVARGSLTAEEAAAARARLHPSAALEDLAPAPFVIEAIPEDLALKRALFRALEGLVTEQTILATNTSSLSITRIAAALAHPERVAGMHFFNPAPTLPLVEVIAGYHTGQGTLDTVTAMTRRLGKTPVLAKDTPGFIVNRVARPFYGEALRILDEGVEAAMIDRIMREVGGFKMGPFELMDLIGIDVNLAVTTAMYDAYYGEPRYRPHPLQQRMVDAGLLGRKTGRGFFEYDDGAR
jgi:3-hydroxybutyryl-CoA dehydrogenase